MEVSSGWFQCWVFEWVKSDPGTVQTTANLVKNQGGNKIGLSLSPVSRKGTTILRSGRRRRPMAEGPTQNRENNPMQSGMGRPARAPAAGRSTDVHAQQQKRRLPEGKRRLFDRDT
jgi:hypothetical protein